MRLPSTRSSSPFLSSRCLLHCSSLSEVRLSGAAATATNAQLDRALRHSDMQWIAVAPHLPDPATAIGQQIWRLAGGCSAGTADA